MTKHSLSLMGLLCLLLSGCSQWDSATHWVSVNLGLSEEEEILHGPKEHWCYSTMGDADCYETPQPGEQSRLIAVDPAYKQPTSRESYQKYMGKSGHSPQ